MAIPSCPTASGFFVGWAEDYVVDDIVALDDRNFSSSTVSYKDEMIMRAKLLAIGMSVVMLLLAPGVGAEESIELRLLRTIWTGVPQGIEPDAIARYVDGPETELTGHLLARAAWQAIGQENRWPEWPLSRLLDKSLNELHRNGPGFSAPVDFPEEFGPEDAVFILVYAMAVSGQSEHAVNVLKTHLTDHDSDFVRAVSLQSLRWIGSPRANSLVQQAADAGPDAQLAGNLLADQSFPFLHELAARWSLIPPRERNRQRLLEIASQQQDAPAELAIYLLGFFPAADVLPQQPYRELDALRRLTHESCFAARYYAIRALALRSQESLPFWVDLLKREEDPWQRAQLVRIGFARFGQAFIEPAQAWLDREPSQYVQWELLHGILELETGGRTRNYWDLIQPPTLQFRLNFSKGTRELNEPDMNRWLSWMERGALPRDTWVRHHLIHRLAGSVHGPQTLRLLSIVEGFPDKAEHWWMLQPLQDPSALPRLRSWRSLSKTDEQERLLTELIDRLDQSVAAQRPYD